jgi:hypothetical protein
MRSVGAVHDGRRNMLVDMISLVRVSHVPRLRARAMRKRTLIIAKTLEEAQAHALEYELREWQFVSGMQDLAAIDPAKHALEFVGEWYERKDLKSLRLHICGRGFDAPLLVNSGACPQTKRTAVANEGAER